MSSAKASTPKRRRKRPDERIMDLVGREWCGNRATPLTNRSCYIHDDGVTRVFATWDDGGFIGIGYPDQWQTHMRTKAARLFAWWVLRTWVADWFGLRSRIYYIALHHKCDGRWKLVPYPHRKTTWRVTPDTWQAEESDARSAAVRVKTQGGEG